MMPINMVNNSKKSSSQPSNKAYCVAAGANSQLLKQKSYELYAKRFLDTLPLSQGKLLDIGCGLGWVVKEAKLRGFEAVGIDPATPYINIGRKKFGLNLKKISLEKFKPSQKFDAVTLNHVFEHIKDSDKFLTKIKALLQSDGKILIACPNIKSLMHAIYQKRWYGLQPTQHYWQFTPALLIKVLRRNGFTVKKVIINSLDYQRFGTKQLSWLGSLLGFGDQVIIYAQKNRR